MRSLTVPLVCALVMFSARLPAGVGDVSNAEQKRVPEKTVESIGELEPKEPWRGLFFTPGASETAVAAKIASAALRDEVTKKWESGAKLGKKPPEILAAGGKLAVEMEVRPGIKTRFEICDATGRWQNHKLITIDFLEGKESRIQVVVDMDDGKDVPFGWEPTEMDIAKARAVGDRRMGELLGKTVRERQKVEVEALGLHDYGPLRRILILSYSKPASGNDGNSLGSILIDFEKMKVINDLVKVKLLDD